jgi:hypothetical protein
MIDGGAPIISLAQADFERLAKYWQDEARAASYTAAHYAAMAAAMREIYRHQIAGSLKEPLSR